jgi:MarR family transcriptional regulator, organic hydroperoxide resistance regulator
MTSNRITMGDMASPKGERLAHAVKQATVQAKGGRAPETQREEEGLAQEAWALLFEVIREQMRNFPTLAAEFELSTVQVHVMRTLGESPLPMSTLAGSLGCDASNVTGLVDRLEGRGLVERQSAQHDRRVKLLALTDAGRALRERLLERLMEPPAAIAGLSATDLRALRDVMRRALENMEEAASAPVQPVGEPQSSKKV